MTKISVRISAILAFLSLSFLAASAQSLNGSLTANYTGQSSVDVDLDGNTSWAAFTSHPDASDPTTYDSNLGNYYDTGNVYPDNTGTPTTDASNAGGFSQVQGDQGDYGGFNIYFTFSGGTYNDNTSYNTTYETGISKTNENEISANYNLPLTGTTTLFSPDEALGFYLSATDYTGSGGDPTAYKPMLVDLIFQLETSTGAAIGNPYTEALDLSDTAVNQSGLYTLNVTDAAAGDILTYSIFSSLQTAHGSFDGSNLTGLAAITENAIPEAAPEPSTWALLLSTTGLAACIQALRRRRV